MHTLHLLVLFCVLLSWGPTGRQTLFLQAVPKKKGDSGKKVLAKILGQILNGAKKADKVTKSWWEIFSVSTLCLIAVGWLVNNNRKFCNISSVYMVED